MSNDSEVPCAACPFWDVEAKNFRCNPNNCQKLSTWLFENAKLDVQGKVEPIKVPIQYVV